MEKSMLGHAGYFTALPEDALNKMIDLVKGIEPEIGEDARNRERMLDIGLAGEPRLSCMRAIGHVEGALDRGSVLLGEVLHAGHELGDRHGLYECRAGSPRSNTM